MRFLLLAFVSVTLLSACVTHQESTESRVLDLKALGGQNLNLATCRARLSQVHNADQLATTGGEFFTMRQLLTLEGLAPLTRQQFELADLDDEVLVCAIEPPQPPYQNEPPILIALWSDQSAWLGGDQDVSPSD